MMAWPPEGNHGRAGRTPRPGPAGADRFLKWMAVVVVAAWLLALFVFSERLRP